MGRQKGKKLSVDRDDGRKFETKGSSIRGEGGVSCYVENEIKASDAKVFDRGPETSTGQEEKTPLREKRGLRLLLLRDYHEGCSGGKSTQKGAPKATLSIHVPERRGGALSWENHRTHFGPSRSAATSNDRLLCWKKNDHQKDFRKKKEWVDRGRWIGEKKTGRRCGLIHP